MNAFLHTYAMGAVILLVLTSLVMLARFSWRWTLAALAVQYLGVAWLVYLSWPLGLTAIKLLVGWMASAVLTTSQAGVPATSEPLSGRIFRLLLAALTLVAVYVLAPSAQAWLQIDQPILLGGLVLCVLGFLQSAVSNDPLRVVIGLLSFLTGFEIIYAALEESVLLAGLLALVNLGLAAAGVYLLAEPAEERPA